MKALLFFIAAAGLVATPPDGMVLIPGGDFTMGSEAGYSMPNERPSHRVRVSPFFLDVNPVTNAEFAKFVEATGYVTVAERKIDWEDVKKQVPPGTPKPPDEMLQPGSLVFRPTDGPVDLGDLSQWWQWTVGANWRHPEGPGSSVAGRGNHPVVHVTWEDANAYAKWAGKRLPTEAEWEFAARGGLDRKRYPWGDEERPNGKFMTNRFTGEFPWKDTAEDGYAGTSPVGAFPANGYGLHDMAGNVWNLCADIYHPGAYAERASGVCCDPTGPAPGTPEMPMARDPSPPTMPGVPRRVMKGGSYLCHPSYCESYRPAARRGVTLDSASTHVGFRCAADANPASQGGGKNLPEAAKGGTSEQ